MELNKDIALTVALERIVALENELIYAKAIAEQLKKQLDELNKEENNE
jgi:hypothetical protein